MSVSLQKIAAALPSGAVVLDHCKDAGCAAGKGRLSALIVKGESLAAPAEKAADCIFFVDMGFGLVAIVVELKKGGYGADVVVEKLANSTGRAAEIIRSVVGESPVRSARVVFAGKHPRVKTPEYVLLSKKGNVLLRRCGEALDSVAALLSLGHKKE